MSPSFNPSRRSLGTTLVAGALLAFTDPARAAAAAASPGSFKAADRLIGQAVESRGLAGAVLGVAVDGRTVLLRGYGLADLENGVAMRPDAVFRVGSATKTFTAAAVLRLVERGALSLNDPLSRFFPAFPRGGEVTIRQLLNHTSGITSYTAPRTIEQAQALASREWSFDALISYIAELKPAHDFDPGTRWAYSNSGYIILGAVIEKASGKSYARFLTEDLLAPLGLKDTTVDDFGEVVPRRAHGYDPASQTPLGFRNPGYLSLSVARSAGAVRSTAADLLAWHAALLGGKVLKPELLVEMTSPGKLNDGRNAGLAKVPPVWTSKSANYGFGLFLDQLDGRRTIGHGGAIAGFNAWHESFPDQRVTITLLGNTSYPAALNIAPGVAAAVFAELGR